MDFNFTPEEEAFRQEIRKFVKNEPPEDFPWQGEDEGYGFGGWSYEYLRRLGEKGWISRCWPTEHGGQGRPLIDMFILFDELAYAWAPIQAFFFLQAVCSAIIRFGSKELKKELLPKAAQGEISFWEGFSETESGSDMLALTTTAIKDGDNYVISGQKTWGSNGHRASHGLVAVRTDQAAPRHKGISIFIIDMDSPGITVRPIVAMHGSAPFAEAFFDGVRVPKGRLLGEENKGLQQILECLEWDRFWARFNFASSCQRMLEEIIKYAKETKRNGVLLAKDPVVRHKIAQLAVEIEVSHAINYQAIYVLNRGETLNYEASVIKTFSDELLQHLDYAGMEILGLYSQLEETSKWVPLKGRLKRWYLCSPLFTLAGGSSEIQRNTIATRGLSLPRS